jgi:hypothetical protein
MNVPSVILTQDPIKPIALPSWILWLQCISFVILFGIWAMPETILIRHVCLIMGAVVGLYVIVRNRHLLLTKQVMPIGLLFLVFGWALFQLFYLGTNPRLQFDEFTSIWKRTFIGYIFAVGFGLALAGYGQNQDPTEGQRQRRIMWGLIYFGFMLPTLIYLVKYVLTFEAPKFGFVAPEYLKLYYVSLPFYMPKTVYVAFCLPLFAISLGQIASEIGKQKWRPLFIFLNVAFCSAVLFVFYVEDIKNGVVYAIILFTIFCVALIFQCRARIRLKDLLLILVMVVALGFFAHSHMKKNESWSNLLADAKVATKVDQYDHWKFNGERGYPKNAMGKMVSPTNYERIAWGVVGGELLLDHPLGYGLIERSFGYIAKERWPESRLDQSHNGWLDLALGLGLPGIALILCALAIGLLRCLHSPDPTHNFGFWLLLSLALLWCTTEVSQKVYFDWLIFANAWVGALSMGMMSAQVSASDLKSV